MNELYPSPIYVVYVLGRPDLTRKYYSRNCALDMAQQYTNAGHEQVRLKPAFPLFGEGNYNDWGIGDGTYE